MNKRTAVQFGFCMGALVLGGCLGGVGNTPGSFAPSLRAAPGAADVHGGGEKRAVFVAGLGAGVPYFSANIHLKDPPRLGDITQGVTRAAGLWIDRQGTLYISNDYSPAPSIAEYKRGTSTPFKTITNGLYVPGSIAVDDAGNLYVADFNGYSGVVLVYPTGASSPSTTIEMPNSEIPGGLAIEKKRSLLAATFDVEHQTGTVYSIALGSYKTKDLNLLDLPGDALGTDKAGNIYVGGPEGNISVFAPGGTSPSRFINAGDSGFYSDFAVTSNGTVYWPNYDLEAMYEFAPGASTPTNVLQEGSGVAAAVGLW